MHKSVENPYKNLSHMLRDSAQHYSKQVAYTTCMPNGMYGSLTYKEVDELSDGFALYLREDLGLKLGDRVAIQLPNCLAYPVAAFGVFKAGCVLVNTNPLYTAPEMIHQFQDSGARVLVVMDMFADRLPEVCEKLHFEKIIVCKITNFFPPVAGDLIRLIQKYWYQQLPEIQVPHILMVDALRAGQRHQSSSGDHQSAHKAKLESYVNPVEPQSLAVLQYTGGTTGVSKGAMLTHNNLLSNMQQVLELVGTKVDFGKETILTALPLYHVFAFTVNMLCFYKVGARNILIPNPRPLQNLKRAFENYKITWLTGVNTLFNGLCNEFWFSESPPKHLKISAAGGMALHSAVAERWEKVAKSPIIEGYGLTEASPVLSFNPVSGVVKRDTIGIAVPGTEIVCMDDAGTVVPVGEPGELCARGPQVMPGYWQRDEETQKVLQNGWLRTGDIATMDQEGYLKIVDRKKDLILVSGFNVYPNEIEDCIAKHPMVSEVAVIGVPDAACGEAVRAYVIPKDSSLQAESIRAHCKQSLTAYKVPKMVILRQELPKTPVGKILRKDLRAEALNEVEVNNGQ